MCEWGYFAYGIMLVVGGFMGQKAGSKISLYMGLLSGTLVLAAVYITTRSYAVGMGIISAVSGILTVVFLARLIKTKKMMPAGILFLLSALIFFTTIKPYCPF